MELLLCLKLCTCLNTLLYSSLTKPSLFIFRALSIILASKDVPGVSINFVIVTNKKLNSIAREKKCYPLPEIIVMRLSFLNYVA